MIFRLLPIALVVLLPWTVRAGTLSLAPETVPAGELSVLRWQGEPPSFGVIRFGDRLIYLSPDPEGAVALLPVGLDHPPGRHQLLAAIVDQRGATTAAELVLEVTAKPRPLERLTLPTGMVSPQDPAVLARINQERERLRTLFEGRTEFGYAAGGAGQRSRVAFPASIVPGGVGPDGLLIENDQALDSRRRVTLNQVAVLFLEGLVDVTLLGRRFIHPADPVEAAQLLQGEAVRVGIDIHSRLETGLLPRRRGARGGALDLKAQPERAADRFARRRLELPVGREPAGPVRRNQCERQRDGGSGGDVVAPGQLAQRVGWLRA